MYTTHYLLKLTTWFRSFAASSTKQSAYLTYAVATLVK